MPGHSIAVLRSLKSSLWATAGGKAGLKSTQNDACRAEQTLVEQGTDSASLGKRIASTLIAAASRDSPLSFNPNLSNTIIRMQIERLANELVAEACPENRCLLGDLKARPAPFATRSVGAHS